MKINLPKANTAIFAGRTVVEITPFPVPVVDENGKPVTVKGKQIHSALIPHEHGDDYSPRPYVAFWYKVPATGDVLMRKLFAYEIQETVTIDKDGKAIKRKSPQERVRLEISRAAGQDMDIDTALTWLENAHGKHSIKAYIEKLPVQDEDGEIRRDSWGLPMYWFRMVLANPDRVIAQAPATGPEAPDNRAAEAEAKRANKDRRGYAGNTGTD